MKRNIMIILAALATATVGCHKDKANDQALQTDLNLANQANSQRSLDSISAVERGYASPAPVATTPSAASHTAARSSTPVRRTHSSSSSGSYGSAPAPAPAPTTTTVKNTKRDAAIGAAAGAIIGAAASRDKIKGGIIGAAAGGILGGVIGNNVDVKKKKTP
jgi:type II secretory pathway pseudopilin PulG